MSKSGNTWFKIKREKLRKQIRSLPRALSTPSVKTVPACDGVKVTLYATEPRNERTCGLNGRMQFDARTYGNYRRLRQGIGWDSYGHAESRLIPAKR